MGNLLPFPWAIRIMEFIYDQSMEPTLPAYPLQAAAEEPAIRTGAARTSQEEIG